MLHLLNVWTSVAINLTLTHQSSWLLMRNCFLAKIKINKQTNKFLRFLEKEKVNSRRLLELVDEACSGACLDFLSMLR